MKTKLIPILLWSCAALLTIGFAVHLYFDYTLHYPYGSAPFEVYVVERFVTYVLPAIGCTVAGIMICKKKRGKNHAEKST